MAAEKGNTPPSRGAGKRQETLEQKRNRLRPIIFEKGEQGAKVVKSWLQDRSKK